MVQDLHPAFTILIALAPAALVVWWGRAVSRHLDDPALPERLLANRRRTSAALVVSIALLLVTAIHRVAWALPLLVLARMVASYPLRKALYDETWSLGSYLSFFIRLIVSAYGLFILIGALPALAMLAGRHDWIVAVVLGAIAGAWTVWSSTVFRLALRTNPVDTPAIVSRFTQLLKDCGLSGVKLEQVDLRGGVFANAVAFPSISAPAVVVTDTLMTRLDIDETTAILAHELGHLEYYNRRVLKKNNTINYTLIVAGSLLSPVLRLTVPQALTAALLIWPVVMIAAMLLRVRHRQKHETSSDLRAVALTGDGEALVRALTKLHAFARVPRRWETEFERRATHPSLARRIQAIRHASGTSPASIGEHATFTGAGSAVSVTFRDDRLEWSEGAATTHTIAYGHLSELRIDARVSRAPRLVAIDSGKRRWELPLQPGDIARAQAILDVVDMRLGKATDPPAVPVGAVRLLAWLAVAAGVSVGQFSVLIAGLLAIVQPASQLAAAAGVSAIAVAGLTWRDETMWLSADSQIWLAIALLFCGAVLIAVAFANRHDAIRPVVPKLLVVLAVCAIFAWTAVALPGGAAIDLHRGVHDWPAVTILTLACAGALAFARPRKARWASAPVALAGLFSGFLGSASFVDRFVNDPFVAPAGVVTVKTLTGSPLTEFSVEFQPSLVWLSPNGRYVALSSDQGERTTIHAGRAGDPLTDFTADDVVFLDESRLLLFERQPRASLLHVVDLAAGNHDGWSLRVPVWWADLSVDRSSERWRLLGWNAAGNIVSAEGHVGDNSVQEAHWEALTDPDDAETLAVSRGVVLALENRFLPSLLQSMPFSTWLRVIWPSARTESRFWSLGDHQRSVFATSRLDLTCRGSVLMDDPATCAAFDGTRTRFFTVDPATRRLTALSSIGGHFFVRSKGDRDWVAGWWDRTPLALRATTGEALRVPAGADGSPYQLAIGDSVVAAVFWRGNTSIVRVYPRP